MALIHVVSFPNGQQGIYKDYQVVNGKVKVRTYVSDDDYEDEYVSVEIDKTYFFEIIAKFIMNSEKDNKSPMFRSMGMCNLNHFAYTYSVQLIEHIGSQTVYSDEPFYSKSGIGTSDFGMYSYHHFNDKKEIVYENERLAYEVECSLDLKQILLPDQQ